MKISNNENKLVLLTSLVALLCITSGSLLYLFYGDQFIENIYKGKSIAFLNELVANHRQSRPWATLEHYLTLGRLVFSRILLLSIVLQLVIVAGLKHRQVLRALRKFFTAATHPLNLGVFRMVLFYTIFNSVNISEITWFSQIPAELRVAPTGVGWLLDSLPINPIWAQISSTLLLVSSFAAMIGLFTRASALSTAILAFYVLGIPQFYGKVNHYHHLMWFAAILAASRCGDALSCDAIMAGWKRADRGLADPPGPSRIYALPLRFVWLLMGVIYFFAGFWKLWGSGLDWALSDNLKFLMYEKWADLGGWTPFFRIDHYPLLYKLGAMGTIFFEMSFIFLLFSDRLRLLAPLGGLFFHTMIDVFMRISFATLLRCYVAFFDWNRIFNWLGRQLFNKEMYVLYDGSCKLCRRTIATLRVFDIFARVTYVNALDEDAIRVHGLHGLKPAALMTDVHAIVENRSWTGFAAYRTLARRIPVVWPALPLLYLWPIPLIGRSLYRHTADSRTCNIRQESSTFIQGINFRPQPSLAAIKAIGCFLVVGNIIFGIGNLHYAWPLAAYPSFAGIATPETQTLEISVLSSTGEVPLTPETFGRDLPVERFLGLVSVALSATDEAQRNARIKSLWQLWAGNNMQLQEAESLRLYKVTLSTIPERRADNPLQRELLSEYKLKSIAHPS